jgi:hypothetical protein
MAERLTNSGEESFLLREGLFRKFPDKQEKEQNYVE